MRFVMPMDREERVGVFAALADTTRLAVVDALQEQDLSPAALARALRIPGNLLAHHLKVLEGAGLVSRTASQHDRRRTYVHLDVGAFDGLLPQLGTIEAPRVVFVCTHNSARSILAEALWNEFSEVPCSSAGTSPSAHVNPKARKAAERLGLSLTGRPPRSVDDVLRPDDLIVSVCDSVNEELVDSTNPRLHWSVPDPARLNTDAAFASTAVDLRDRVASLAPRVNHCQYSRKGRP
jgi:protein-tyrosine-phosphatase